MKLTGRQKEVLELLSHGCTNLEIAKRLNIGLRTVKNYLSTLYLSHGLYGAESVCKRIQLVRMYLSRSVDSDAEQFTSPVFSSKESTLISLVSLGIDNASIARHMGTTEQTVKNQTQRVFDKTGTWNKLELAVWALRTEIRRDQPHV